MHLVHFSHTAHCTRASKSILCLIEWRPYNDGERVCVLYLSFASHVLLHPPSRKSSSKSSSSFCTSLADRLTVYDSRTPDKTTIIDVLCCSRTTHKKIVSSGPSLLIEFETSSNRTAMGFSAKYRFSEWPGEWGGKRVYGERLVMFQSKIGWKDGVFDESNKFFD